jgi:hypothetical protein
MYSIVWRQIEMTYIYLVHISNLLSYALAMLEENLFIHQTVHGLHNKNFPSNPYKCTGR